MPKLSKSQSRRVESQKELKSFFYPKLGLSGATIKAATKEDADAKVAELMNPKPPTTVEEVEGKVNQ